MIKMPMGAAIAILVFAALFFVLISFGPNRSESNFLNCQAECRALGLKVHYFKPGWYDCFCEEYEDDRAVG